MKKFIGHVTTGVLVAGLLGSAIAAPKTSTADAIKARQAKANAASMKRHETVLGNLKRSHDAKISTQKGIRNRQRTATIANLNRHHRVLSQLKTAHTAKLKAQKK